MKTVKISLQASLLAEIDRAAKRESRSRSELLREATRMYIEREKSLEEILAYGRRRASERGLTEADVMSEIQAYRRRKKRTQNKRRKP